MSTDKKTKDELFAELTAYRVKEEISILLDKKLDPILTAQKSQDSRLKALEDEVAEIKETIQPFTTFRRRAWTILITFILGGGALAFIWFEISKYNGGN